MKQKLHKIRARSLEEAMDLVKRKFGSEALIQETREIKKRKEYGLGLESVYEVCVVEDSGDFTGDLGLSNIYGREKAKVNISERSAGILQTLNNQINRVDKLTLSFHGLEDKLKRLNSDPKDYPVYEMLIRGGVFANTADIIMNSYFKQLPNKTKPSRESAIFHIKRNLRVVETSSWDDIDGVHFFLGVGGSGKTTLIAKLAAKLSGRGRRVTIISLFPRHRGDVARLEALGEMLGIRVLIANTLEEIKKEIETNHKGVILVDTPCILSVKELTSERFINFITKLNTVHSNYVFDISAGPGRIEKELEIFDRVYCDFAVLTRLDIIPGGAEFLNLLSKQQLVFSLINDSADLDDGLEIASRDRLISLITPSFISSSDDFSEKSPFSLNYKVNLVDKENADVDFALEELGLNQETEVEHKRRKTVPVGEE